MTVSSKLADFTPWYSQNQQFSSSCYSTRVISGLCFWELKQWQLLRSALQHAVGAGLGHWSTGWCLVWHSTWTTLHATARGSEFCQHAQSVVTVPVARYASVMLPVLFHQLSFSSKFICSLVSSNLYSGNDPFQLKSTSDVVQWPVNLGSGVSKSSLWGPQSRFSVFTGRKWLSTR